jgi:zinc transporter 5/7
MGSVGVIISSLLIKHFGLLIADPICSIVIATLIVFSALPLAKDTARVLLLTLPVGLERNIQQSVLQILAMEGVKGYKVPRFWTHAPNILTGSIHIQATQDANEQQVIRLVNNLFSSIGFNHFTTQVEKDEFIAERSSNYEDDEDPASVYGRSNALKEPSIAGIGSNDMQSSGGNDSLLAIPTEIKVLNSN